MIDMPFVHDFRQPETIKQLVEKLKKMEPPKHDINIMEVCGTHTMSIFRHGLRQLLPPWVGLISGPGCPVCVTDDEYIARACAIGIKHNAILMTFGDLMSVPGRGTSLEKARAEGADVRVVYTPHQCIKTCRENPDRPVIYLAVGFETTAPVIAALAREAKQLSLSNLFLLVAHKLVPPALEALAGDSEINVHGFICPPHVCAIIGAEPFKFIPEKWHRPCVIAGFEPVDILLGMINLQEQFSTGEFEVVNLYKRVVKEQGNRKAQEALAEVFEPCDAVWRGIGMIPGSGLKLRDQFSSMDAAEQFPVDIPPSKPSPCRCGDVLRGIITPNECPLFGKTCNPGNPFGPCMVSSEGTCAAYYKYDLKRG